jgi:signal transduction histidine kinase
MTAGRDAPEAIIARLQAENAALRAQQAGAAERARELSALLEVARSLTSTLELEPLLGAIIDQAGVVAGYDGASVLTFEDGALRIIYRRGPDDADRRERLGVSVTPERGGLFLRYLEQRRPLIIGDVRGDDPLARAYQKMMGGNPADIPYLRYVRAWMGVPLALGDRVIGVLVLAHSRPGYYTPHHAELVTAMASQAAVAIENARLYAASRQLAAMEERARLARELHDSVTQAVFSLGMLTRTAQVQHARGLPALGQTLDRIGALSAQALAELRALLFELRPAALTEEGLAGALPKLVAALQVRTETKLTYAGPETSPMRLPPDVELCIFRIVQEALGNTIKHAGAKTARVQMDVAGDRLTVNVTDDGAGFDPNRPDPMPDTGRGGLGLGGMKERAAAAGITVDVQSAPGAGTRVTIEASAPAAGVHGRTPHPAHR